VTLSPRYIAALYPPPASMPPSRGPPAKLTPSSFAYGCLLGEGAYGRVIHARLHSNGKLGSTDYAIKMIEKRVVQRENKVRGMLHGVWAGCGAGAGGWEGTSILEPFTHHHLFFFFPSFFFKAPTGAAWCCLFTARLHPYEPPLHSHPILSTPSHPRPTA
jgi:hypothetical protein